MNFRRRHKKNNLPRSWWKYEAAQHRDATRPQGGRLRRLLDNLVTDDPYYDWADQYLDGLTTDTYEEWTEKRDAVA